MFSERRARYTTESSALPNQEQHIALTLLGLRYTSIVDLEIVEKDVQKLIDAASFFRDKAILTGAA